MKILAYLKKTFLENLRDWKILLFTFLFAPSFVYLMWGYLGAATPAYKLLVDNQDNHQAGNVFAAQGLIDAWKAAKHPDGKPMFIVTEVDDSEAAKDKLKQRDADLLVNIPVTITPNSSV
jgi:ABC-2 type transport system permease protein